MYDFKLTQIVTFLILKETGLLQLRLSCFLNAILFFDSDCHVSLTKIEAVGCQILYL